MPTSKDLQQLLERIQFRLDESFVGIGSEVTDLPPEDLAELLNQLNLAEAAAIVSMLPLARCIELYDQPTMRRRAAILEQLEPSRVAAILEGLSADERTDVIQKMKLHQRHRIMPKFSPEVRAELEDLLQYPDHTAGGIMTTEFVRLDPKMTVGDALRHIRAVAQEKVMAELDRPLLKVSRRKPVTVNVLDDQEVVAQKIGKYNLLAVPVVEEDGSVVGFVTVDDVIDVLIEEQTEDLLRMAAVEPGAMDKPYFDNPISRVVRKRIGWLLLLFVAGTLTSAVLHRFENELAAVVALAFFIPLLIGTGGNAGAQTVMTVIRSLALGEVGVRHAWRVALREATTGMLVGLMVAPIAFGQALLWQAPLALALTVSVTMFAICVWSTTVGALIPILAQRFGVDPAVLSAPLITTLVDATGLVIYFTIAKAILGV
jgi:magnesium transporter